MWSGNLKIAIASLKRSKWRTIFTMLGVIIGVSSVVTIVSLGEGLKSQIIGQVDQLGSDIITVRPGQLLSNGSSDNSINLYALLAPSTLTSKDTTDLSKLDSVASATPIEFTASSAKTEGAKLNNVAVLGTSANFVSLLHEKLDYGSFFPADGSGEYIAIIGSGVAHKLFGELNPAGHTVNILGQDFIVHGVLAPSSASFLSVAQTDLNSSIFIPTATANTLTNGHTNILQVLVKPRSGANVDTVVSQINHKLLLNHAGQNDFTVLKQYELLRLAGKVVNTSTDFISGIAGVSLLVGGIGIMDIMLVSVSERTREIGIRKAVGASNRQIRSQFLVEGMALTIGGGLIGVIVSLFINLALKIYSPWNPIISFRVLALAVLVSVGVGVVFSLAPAIKASRKDPIEALRNE